MADTGDRMDRAGRYVLGLMDDEERERAERDLETDPALREAMVEIAERMHVFDRAPASGHEPQDQWRSIKERIDAMPQMQRGEDVWRPAVGGAETSQPQAEKPATFGRRKSDAVKTEIVPSPVRGVDRIGPHSMPGRRALVLALCLAAAFALGYATGVSSPSLFDTADTAP
jgi:anti-sigma factor RsiW